METRYRDDARIYVLVADSIVLPARHDVPEKLIEQPLGRQVAQACHAVTKIRAYMFGMDLGRGLKQFLKGAKSHELRSYLDGLAGNLLQVEAQAITTIVLSARDNAEIWHLHNILQQEDLVPHKVFHDTNEDYGPGVEAVTAMATWPFEPNAIAGVLDHLPLWGSERHLRGRKLAG